MVAEVEPQALDARHRPNHRHHVGQARAAPEPGLRVDAAAEREDLAGLRLDPVELHRRRRRVAQRELGAGRQADALHHRRDEIADLGVDDGAVEHGIAGDAVMHVIAPLPEQRDAQALRARHVVGPGPERDHDLGRLDPALGPRRDAPARVTLLERARLTLEEGAALLDEELGIGAPDGTGITDRHGVGQVHGADEDVAQVRLHLAELRAVDLLVVDAELAPLRRVLVECLVERRARAVGAEVAGRAQHPRDAGLRHQRLVLADAALDERQHGARAGELLLRRRGDPVAKELRRDARQRRQVVVGLGHSVAGVAQEGRPLAREHVGHDALALDEAGVAVARLLGGAAPVDQRHLAAAPQQVQRGRDADHAGPENDDVVLHGRCACVPAAIEG